MFDSGMMPIGFGSTRVPRAGFAVPAKRPFLNTVPQKKFAKARTPSPAPGTGALARLLQPCSLIWVFLLPFVAAFQSTRAESPSITAVLSSSETALGSPVQLEIKVTGARGVSAPPNIQAEGLDIRYTGESQNFVMRNFQTSASITLNYTIMPVRTGTFTIPPQSVHAGNTTLRTPELTLHVVEAANRNAGRNRAPARGAPVEEQARLAFAELLVPKKSAYLGETIPVVLRVGFISRARLDGMEPPHIDGQGFTVQKLSDEERNMVTIGGHTYLVRSFKTAISAARVGSLQIGPVETKAAVLVPKRSTARRMPFDPFDGDDPFADPFFQDPFGAFLERREVAIKSDPVTLEVKALPPGAPASFSGALGNFSMTAEANPKHVQVADPITIKAEVSGRGNFDRVNAPALSEEEGWHKYPASANFKQDDDVGISGTKTFEMVVSPNEVKRNLPPLVFTYFDPVKEKYVTLQTSAVPLTVEGNALPPPSAAAAAATASPAASASSRAQDILPPISERGKVVATFAPLYTRKGFWLAQLAPLAIVLALGIWRVRKARANNRAALRVIALRRESDELLRKLRGKELPPQQYFSDASRLVQLKTALKANVEPGSVDAESASRAFALDEERSAQVRNLFATSDELRYSGSANGAVSPERRREALALIESLS